MTFNWKANEELTCECEPEMTDLFGAFPFNDHLASLLHPAVRSMGLFVWNWLSTPFVETWLTLADEDSNYRRRSQ